LLIFKRKTLPKSKAFLKDVIVRAQEKGWMTEKLMLEWLKIVCSRRPGAFLNHLSILDFRFSPCSESFMFSFGYFPGIRLRFADVSEPSVRSIFNGWMKNIYFIQPLKMDLTEGSETSEKLNLTPGKYPKENIQKSPVNACP
jgi:hypothetical protein